MTPIKKRQGLRTSVLPNSERRSVKAVCCRTSTQRKNTQETQENCLHSDKWKKHKAGAETRLHCHANADRDWPVSPSVRSVDLQKVIMLLRMPGVKSALYTRRICVYHETFASVGEKNNIEKNICCLAGSSCRAECKADHICICGGTRKREGLQTCHLLGWQLQCPKQELVPSFPYCVLGQLQSSINWRSNPKILWAWSHFHGCQQCASWRWTRDETQTRRSGVRFRGFCVSCQKLKF